MSKEWIALILALIVALIIVATFFIAGCGRSNVENNLPLTLNNMKLTSPAFENNQNLPVKYTCDGEGVNPLLVISEIPEGAQGLVLISDDPDAPSGDFVHWLVWNIGLQTTEIMENSIPEGAVEGLTSVGKPGYVAPCPPSGTHHYYFKIYALDVKLNLSVKANKVEVERAMQGHILDQAVLVGLCSR